MNLEAKKFSSRVGQWAVAGLCVVSLSSCGFFSGLSGRSPHVVDSAPSVKLDPKKIQSAVPKIEEKSRGGNRNPYTVLGKTYSVLDSSAGFRERGIASWYGKKFHGRLTSNGEQYDMYKMTAAHKHLPLPSYVYVTNLENKKRIIVRVNDRGPFHSGRVIDLSYAAATKLGILGKGTAKVEVEAIDPVAWHAERNKRKPQSTQLADNRPSLKTPTVQAVSTEDSLLYLQLGAFTQLDAAQTLQNQLLEQHAEAIAGYGVVIHPTQEASPVYRVRIGPLPDAEALARIKDQPQLGRFANMYAVRDPIN